jgi:hypothetical protein
LAASHSVWPFHWLLRPQDWLVRKVSCNAGQQMLGAGLPLLGGNLHFRLGQAVDGALDDQVIAAKGKYQ